MIKPRSCLAEGRPSVASETHDLHSRLPVDRWLSVASETLDLRSRLPVDRSTSGKPTPTYEVSSGQQGEAENDRNNPVGRHVASPEDQSDRGPYQANT
jgi:hypothetical protein